MQQPGWASVSLAAWAIALAGLVPPSAGTLPTSSSGALVPTAVSIPEPVAPQVAFAGERAEILKVSVPRRSAPEPWEKQDPTAYRAELSTGYGAQRPAYISTKDSSQGEVYVPRSDPDGTIQQRITCDNSAAEFHPVISPDGTMLAYASDTTGNLDIWLVRLAEDLKDCPEAQRLTVAEAADTWPAWAPDSSSVIFSSGREDPLGDLFQVPVPEAGGNSEANLTQLTDGPDADTQPAVYRRMDIESGPGPTWVAFTTTRYEKGGSLAALRLPDAAATKPGVFSLWPTATEPNPRRGLGLGSAEPAWSPSGDRIAFTSTRDDPHGDVLIAPLVFADASFYIDPSRVVKAAAVPGMSESHAAWLNSDRESAFVAYTSRTSRADISDANAADGSARRVVAAATLDNAGPAYSPDGTALVWSQERSTGNGRELIRSRADGTNASPLNYERDEEDVDVDPIWSPDGRRIAFTRYEWARRGYGDPAPWIVDLEAEREESARAPSRRASAAPPEGVRYVEENPAWSPDGSFVAVNRRYAPDLKAELKASEPSRLGQDIKVEAEVTNVGQVETEPTFITLTFPADLIAASVSEGCEQGRGEIKCRVGILTPGASSVQTWTLRGNTAGDWPVTAVVLQPGDSNPANNTSNSTLKVTGVSDLEVALKADVQIQYEESPRVYTVTVTATVTNRGQVRAGPSTLTFTDYRVLSLAPSPSCFPEGPCGELCELKTATCPIEALAPAASAERQIVLKGTTAGSGTITGTVSKDEAEISVNNNTDLVPVALDQIIERRRPSGSEEPTPPVLNSIRPVSSWHVGSLAPAQVPAPPRAVLPPRFEPITSPPELWVLNSTTGEANPVKAQEPCAAACTVTGAHPAWSPDGTRIVATDRGMLQLVALRDDDAAGGPDVPHAAASVTAVTGFNSAGAPTASRAEVSSAEDPAWAPDGAEIYFTGQPAGQPYHQGIYAVTPDGSKLRTVVQGRGPETQPALQPWADLAIQLAADPVTISKGDTATLNASAVNNGPSPAASVKILIGTPDGLTALSASTEGCDVSARSVRCTLDKRLNTGAVVDIEVQVKGDAEGEHTSTATVTADTPDPRTSDNQSKTSTRTPGDGSSDIAVELTLDQSQGWKGGKPATAKAKVTNNGPAAASGISIKVSTTGSLTLQPTDACTEAMCSLGSLDSGANREVDLKFNMPASEPTGGVSARPAEISVEASTSSADPKQENNTDREGFTVHQPGVTIYPAVGKPGDVLTVVVEGLPPDAPVKFAWSKGIPPDSTKIEHDGTELRRGLLLLRRDQLGTRDIIVTSADTEALFGELRGTVLVVARPVAPTPDFIGRG